MSPSVISGSLESHTYVMFKEANEGDGEHPEKMAPVAPECVQLQSASVGLPSKLVGCESGNAFRPCLDRLRRSRSLLFLSLHRPLLSVCWWLCWSWKRDWRCAPVVVCLCECDGAEARRGMRMLLADAKSPRQTKRQRPPSSSRRTLRCTLCVCLTRMYGAGRMDL
jgi:hypothetical protein